jgi:hypothetical protein
LLSECTPCGCEAWDTCCCLPRHTSKWDGVSVDTPSLVGVPRCALPFDWGKSAQRECSHDALQTQVSARCVHSTFLLTKGVPTSALQGMWSTHVYTPGFIGVLSHALQELWSAIVLHSFLECT